MCCIILSDLEKRESEILLGYLRSDYKEDTHDRYPTRDRSSLTRNTEDTMLCDQSLIRWSSG